MPATLAFIAHDHQKEQLVQLIQQYEAVLVRYQLIATETTAQWIQDSTTLTVTSMLKGSMGGDIQIAALVAEGAIAAVIFLVEPRFQQSQEPKCDPLQRMCTLHDVPFALNVSTAAIVLEHFRQQRVAHLIFNPVSGQGNGDEDLKIIRELLEPAMVLQVYPTTPDINPSDYVQSAIAAEADLVLASGGDGTVSAVAGALINSGIPLGILPRGTANAFATALGITAGLTPLRYACNLILEGHTSVVDVARCNDQPMVLLAGIGLEAEVVERANREAKNRWGVLAYLMEGFRQFNQQELFETEIEIEGVVKTFQAGAVTIANAAPPTSVMAQGAGQVNVNDGLLDITIAAPQSDLEAVGAMVNLVGAALLKSPTTREDIINLQTKRVKVSTSPPQKVVLDGELIGTTPIEIECIPGGLTLYTPLNALADGVAPT